eukprot:8969475-Heterocapsa_arctica.AAC.1
MSWGIRALSGPRPTRCRGSPRSMQHMPRANAERPPTHTLPGESALPESDHHACMPSGPQPTRC